MAENSDKATDFPIGELREITLLIPGEHFFCETLPLPTVEKNEKNRRRENGVDDGCPLGITGVHEIVTLLVGALCGGHAPNHCDLVSMVG